MLALKTLKDKREILITKSDKTNQIVILNRDHYTSKLDELLAHERTYEKLRKNPLEYKVKVFNKRLKKLLGSTDVSSFKA